MMRASLAVCRCFPPALACLLALLCVAAKSDDPKSFDDQYLVIDRDTQLDPNKLYGRIIVRASNITIEGNGALLQGSITDGPDSIGNKRKETAIQSNGQSNVVLRNVRCRGWETGLKLADCDRWTVEDCDFSDNFHDPEFGWGENGHRGGIVFERVRSSTLRRNRANRVWDACVLVDSDDNIIVDNDFSHTSNTCLKLWHACRNTIAGNDLSYGIRKKPDEVHARDSTGVLIESGSDSNRFLANNCTYGGDGIFIRVLNRWCSVGNYFEGNDCSFANNNGFECWAPENTFVRNKANHCSYGFWLGGSDCTLLEDNEACYNGLKDGNHNSPHLPYGSHAGIVFMFGPSSHTIARGNRCEFNNGAGIALIGDIDSRGEKWKAFHWIIEGNQLNRNRWGVYARFADWIQLNANQIEANSDAAVEAAESVTRLKTGESAFNEVRQSQRIPARLEVRCPSSVIAGEPFQVGLMNGKNESRKVVWDLGDDTTGTGDHLDHVYKRPGFYRLGVTAESAQGLQLGSRDIYVVSREHELGTDPLEWSFKPEAGLNVAFTSDAKMHIAGPESIFADIRPYHGFLVQLQCRPKSGAVPVSSQSRISFWLKAINPNLPGWQSENPEIRLTDSEGSQVRLKPKRDLLSSAGVNEARLGWQNIQVMTADDPGWTREGENLKDLAAISIGLDSWDGGPLHVWIDGLTVEN